MARDEPFGLTGVADKPKYSNEIEQKVTERTEVEHVRSKGGLPDSHFEEDPMVFSNSLVLCFLRSLL